MFLLKNKNCPFFTFYFLQNQIKYKQTQTFLSFFDKNTKDYKIQEASNFPTGSIDGMYRGSPPYAHFGTWKKPCYMKFVLVGM